MLLAKMKERRLKVLMAVAAESEKDGQEARMKARICPIGRLCGQQWQTLTHSKGCWAGISSASKS